MLRIPTWKIYKSMIKWGRENRKSLIEVRATGAYKGVLSTK